MSTHPPLEDCSAAKRYCWRMYSRHPWFRGCGINTDEDEAFVELRVDPDYTDRFTYVTEHEHTGVKIRLVRWDQERHGDCYDPAAEKEVPQ